MASVVARSVAEVPRSSGARYGDPLPPDALLPDPCPTRLLDEYGEPVDARYPLPADRMALEMYRRLVVGRRLDRQADALARQGALAVYPSSHGQEACQIGTVLALRRQDWLFPTYRDSVAVMSRGVDPVEVLTLMRGDRHCGYDPRAHRVAPQCTPLATQAPHAVGLAHAARLDGDDVVALALVGDGGTSEGDFHEACNLGGVLRAPVVFFVQNNQYAISVPLAEQTRAPTLAHKAVGYGIAGRRVDGNDVFAVHAVVSDALAVARAGGGPSLVEAVTYRMDPHTSSDDASRYRDPDEATAWHRFDPVARVEHYLRRRELLDDGAAAAVAAVAEDVAATLRARITRTGTADPGELFAHVFAAPSPQLRRQEARLRAELAAAEDGR